MKPSELRIGNLVYGISGGEIKLPVPIPLTICQIEVFNVLAAIGNPFDPCSDTPWNRLGYNDISPIPLDAEWLERFLFKQVKLDRTPFYELTIENIKFIYYAGNLDFGVMGISQYEFVRMPKIKYVHQLQNLFFCLVGKDL